jgi:hypothetical protein
VSVLLCSTPRPEYRHPRPRDPLTSGDVRFREEPDEEEDEEEEEEEDESEDESESEEGDDDGDEDTATRCRAPFSQRVNDET